MPTMLDSALEYIAQGYAVFPVGRNKKPITEHGLKDATKLIPGVKEFWTKYPDAGIAIVTDGLVVLDFDAHHNGLESLKAIEVKYGYLPITRTHLTGGGGYHYIYQNPNGTKIRNTVALGGYEGVDIRANGGYIVVPPSSHPSGNNYELVTDVPLEPCPHWVIELAQTKTPTYTGTAGEKIPIGQNDQWLYRRACTYRGQGDNEEIIFDKLKIDAKRLEQDPTRPPYTDKDFQRIARSAMRHSPNIQQADEPKHSRKLSMNIVTQWLSIVSGSFNVKQLWSELNITSTEDKSYLRLILHRLSENGIIAKASMDGAYRKLETEKRIIEWEKADPNNYLPIWLPFGIHRLCKVFPKSILVVAGSKGAGKTAFLTQCIMPNVKQSGMVVDFYNSETGAEQLNERFTPLNIPTPPPFKTYERYDNFADVIEPDHLSIIDYLDLNSEVYLVGTEIDNIFRKLTTGCAIIGLQKPPPTTTYVKGVRKVIDRDLAYGGGFTAKRAVVYASLGSQKLKLVVAKTPLDKRINPANMMWSYEFDEDGYFKNIKRYYPNEQDY